MRAGKNPDPWLLLSLWLCTFALYPLANPGLPVTSDGLLQPYRLVELDAAIRAGTLYPRWAPNMWLGHGYPLFNFYAPLSYYISEAFHLAGLDFEMSIKAVIVLGVLLAALAAYLLGRHLFGPLGGLLAATAYVYSPHFLTEMYRRGDYPQLLALGILPLVLWGSLRLAEDSQVRWMIALALSLAALLLTHSVTAMLFAPVYALWLLVCLWLVRHSFQAASSRLVASNLLGMGLSACFWLPAIGERPLVQTHRLLTGHFDFRLHFQTLSGLLGPTPLTDPRLLNGPMAFDLGQAHVLLAILGGIAAIATTVGRPWRPASGDSSSLPMFSLLMLGRGVRGESIPPQQPKSALRPKMSLRRGSVTTAISAVLWAMLVIIFSIYMMLPASRLIWESSDVLALTQFPWRWLGIAGLGLALLAGAIGWAISWLVAGSRHRDAICTIVAAAAAGLIIFSAFPNLYPVLPFDRYPNLTVADITRFELTRGPMGTSSGSEFLPRWVKTAPGRTPMVDELLAGQPPTKVDLGAMPKGVQARVLSHGPTWDEVEVDAPESFGMLFRTLYFPGWRAFLDGQEVEITPFETYGFVHLSMPAGQHRVLLRFADTPIRTAAQWISAFSLIALLGIAAWQARRRRYSGAIGSTTGDGYPAGSPGARPALFLSMALAALLIFKIAYVDPHTTWFRREIAIQQPEGGAQILGQSVALLGFGLDILTPAPGQTWGITLYWQGLQPVVTNYKAFTHLVTPDETRLVAQKDNEHPGLLPTSWWRQDKIIADYHPLPIPPGLAPGRYPLVVGMYDPKSGDRLIPQGSERSYVIIAYLVVK